MVSSFKLADEVIVYIKRSKTDQYNVGATRNQFRSDTDLCPVQALWELEQHFPERFKGSEIDMPLFRYLDGSPIRREHIQHYLEIAAAAIGVPSGHMGSHSLRIGGATALYHVCGGDLQLVRRFGRWASDTFHRYLWDPHEQLKGIARKMSQDRSELTQPR